MLQVILIAIFVSTNAWAQFLISPKITPTLTLRNSPWDDITTDGTVLTPPWLKIIKDSMNLNDMDKVLTRSTPLLIKRDWTTIDLKTEEKKKEELCLKFGIGCFDVIRMDETKDEMRRKEEAINEMVMRDELCRKMGMECRKNDMCEKMGIMCTKDEMCKKMGMDCSKKDMCELMGVDCKRVDMCEKMGVMCTKEEMCKKKGIGCRSMDESILMKTVPTLKVKGDLMWVKDEFDRPVLMDSDGRRFVQQTLW